jgi:lysophospholipase L1-like esterase
VALGGALFVGRRRWIRRKSASLQDLPPDFGDSPLGLDQSVRRGHLVLIGDSRMAEWPLDGFHGPWTVSSYGVGGDTVGATARRFDGALIVDRPQLVVIGAGINDLVAASYLRQSQRLAVVERVVDGLLAMSRRAQTAGITAVVFTIVPPARPGWARRLVWNRSLPRLVAEANARLLAAATVHSVPLFNAAQVLSIDAGRRIGPAFSRDTLHFNATGYDRLTASLEAFLAARTIGDPKSAAR